MLQSDASNLQSHDCRAPSRAVGEFEKHGFRIERVLGDDYPRVSHQYTTSWYYYVFFQIRRCGRR